MSALAADNIRAADTPQVKRVLILHSFGRDFAPFNWASAGFRTELAQQSAVPIEFLEASLETARFGESGADAPFVEYLQALFVQRPVDLLVPFGAPAMNFLLRHRDKLFPGAPLLVGAIDRRPLGRVNLGADATAVGVDLDLPGIVENILRLLPRTAAIEVVMGNSPLERFWLEQLRQDFQPFANGVRFNWLNGLSFEEMRKRISALPADTAVLYAVLLVDAAGVPHEQERALEILHQETTAPIFGAFDSQLGRGIVGGPLYPAQQVGREAAGLAVRILNGELPGSMPPVLLSSTTPVYDWRELRRWRISESRLPSGSIIQFRQPSIWQRYRIWMLGGVGIFALQAALIFLLLVERKQRRGAQETLDERLRFEALVSQLSAKFIHLPVRQIDDQIIDSLREVAQFLGFDFSSLSVFTGPAVGRVAFVWQAPGTPTMPSDLTDRDFPWLARELFAGRDVSFLSPAELPAEAETDRATAERIRNRSVHCVPLLAGDTPVGVLNIGTFNREQGIASDLLRRLRLLGEIFANALARKRSDELLRESEERLALAAQSANLGVWSWDLSTDAIWATEKCRALYGVSAKQEIDFQTFFQSLYADDRERVRRSVDSALKGEKDFAEEYRVVLPGGAIRWIGAFGRGHYNGFGKPIRMLGVSIDVTERKQAEERFRLAVEASPNAIVMVNEQGLIVLVNELTEKLFGYERHELIGQPVDLLLPERFRAAHRVHRQGFFAAPETRAMGAGRDLFARSKEGREFQVEIGLNPIQTNEETLVLTAIVDISERKRTEAELQRNRDELAHITRVSTLGELAASLAHELNQPLTGILSNAQAAQRFLAASRPDLDEVKDILKDIVEDDNRASEVIQKLRALAKKEKLTLMPLGLADVVKDAIELLHSDTVLNDVRVSLDAGHGLPLAHGDRVQLQQVVLNLLRNGIEAMKDCPLTEREIRVRVERHESRFLRVAVRDRGGGLAPDQIENVFQPFYTTKREGLGMGLSISRSIIEAHGGRLWAENNPDRGATFYFTVPVEEGSVEGRVTSDEWGVTR